MTNEAYITLLTSISNKNQLRNVIVQLFQYTESLGKKYKEIVTTANNIASTQKDDRYLHQSGSNLKKIVSDSQWYNDYTNPITGKVTAAYFKTCKLKALIGYAMFFWKEYDIYWEKNEVKKIKNSQTGISYYDVFYWRSVETTDLQKETIGIARIKITNWETAEMRYLYHSQNKSFALSQGKVEKVESGVYICLSDITKKNDGTDDKKAHTFIVLHNVDMEKSDFMVGCITSKRRLSSAVISSIVVLQKDNIREDLENSEYLSEFDDKGKRRVINVDRRINYYLSGRHVKTEEEPYVDQIDKLITNNDVKILKNFCGEFQNIYISTNEVTKYLKNYKIEISEDGIAKITKEAGVDKGRARVISDDKILLQFNYHFNPSARAFQYSLLLQKSGSSGFTYLEGVYMGLVSSQLASGRVILKRLTDELKDNFIPRKITIDSTSIIKKLNDISGNDSEIINFFSNSTFNPFTDAGLFDVLNMAQRNLPPPPTPTTPLKVLSKDILGTYYCYFNVKAIPVKGHREDSSKYGQLLYKVPLQITEKKVFIKYEGEEGTNEIEGYYIYDGKSKVVLVCASEYYYITIFFRTSIQPAFIYGMFNVLNDTDKRSEMTIQSSYMVMQKLNNATFSALKFEEPVKDLNGLIGIEKELKIGIITKLFGHYQRTVMTREPNEEKDKLEQLEPRQSSYRRVFWNSACFNSLRCNSEQDKKEKNRLLKDTIADLYRAYNHGFAMKYFGDKEYGQKGFPKELKVEIDMIQNDIKKEENDPTKIFKEPCLKEFLIQKFISFQYEQDDDILK